MRHFCVALIVVALLVLDFLAHLPGFGMSATEQRGWGWASGFGLVCGAWYFWKDSQ